MTSGLRRAAHGLTPPILGRALARRSRHAVRLEDGYPTWAAAEAASSGYSEQAILAQVMQATDEVVAGRAAFERDGVAFDEIEYRWPVAAALLGQAARDGGSLRVLDFGGSLGSTCRQYHRLLDGIDVLWGVVEQPAFVEAGARYADPSLSFHRTIEECAAAIDPNVVLLSSVLQYLPDPGDVLSRLSATPARTLVIDRTPMTGLDHDIPAVQVVPPSIYAARYPAWLLSRAMLLERLAGWEVVDTFPGIEPAMTTSSGTAVEWCGLSAIRPAA